MRSCSGTTRSAIRWWLCDCPRRSHAPRHLSRPYGFCRCGAGRRCASTHRRHALGSDIAPDQHRSWLHRSRTRRMVERTALAAPRMRARPLAKSEHLPGFLFGKAQSRICQTAHLSLKSEIARVARKEMWTEIDSFKKASAQYRSERRLTFGSIDGFVRRSLRALLRRRDTRPGRGLCRSDHRRWPNAYFAALGLFTLKTAWTSAPTPMRNLPTGEPCTGELHAWFGGRGG